MKRRVLTSLFAIVAITAAPVARAEISNGSVKIGVLTDMSGPYADNVGAGSVLAARMAVEDFGGKVAGVPVEIVSADHQNKADVGSAIARAWYDVEGVDMITEVVSSAVALAVQQLAREKNKTLMATGPGTPDLTGKACSPNGVHWAYDNFALANVATGPLVNQGQKTWYFLTADYTFGHALEIGAIGRKNSSGHFAVSIGDPIGCAVFHRHRPERPANGPCVELHGAFGVRRHQFIPVEVSVRHHGVSPLHHAGCHLPPCGIKHAAVKIGRRLCRKGVKAVPAG